MFRKPPGGLAPQRGVYGLCFSYGYCFPNIKLLQPPFFGLARRTATRSWAPQLRSSVPPGRRSASRGRGRYWRRETCRMTVTSPSPVSSENPVPDAQRHWQDRGLWQSIARRPSPGGCRGIRALHKSPATRLPGPPRPASNRTKSLPTALVPRRLPELTEASAGSQQDRRRSRAVF
jgi:hypothetical protein